LGSVVNQTQSSPPRSFWKSPFHATLMLVVVTLLWGLSFPLVKNWQEAAADCPGGAVVSSTTLIALRLGLGALIFGLLRPDLAWGALRHEHGIGLLIGFFNFLGFAPQVIGLHSVSPAFSSFFTSLCSAWVPLLGWLCFRTQISFATLLGLVLGIAGATVLGLRGSLTWQLAPGDWLSLLGSVMFAVEIVLLDRLGRRVRPGRMTLGFFAGTGLPSLVVALLLALRGEGLAPWLSWTASRFQDSGLRNDLIVLTLFCTVLSSHWLVTYQPRVTAGRAALIYLLEPIFATLFSIWFGQDPVTVYLVIGGVLILAGNFLVDLPLLVRDFLRARLG
jgi:drug/metabolite transporter (DMT)-like permease